MKKFNKNLNLLALTPLITFPIIGVSAILKSANNLNNIEDATNQKPDENLFKHISDFETNEITYKANHPGAMFRDKQYKGNLMSLNINGQITTFNKGIGVHAGCELVFDLRKYDYDKFSSYYGMDSTQNKSTGAKISFYFSESNQLENAIWQDLQIDSEIYTYEKQAKFISLNIKGKKFIKIKIDSIKGLANSNNHINFARAIFHKQNFNYDLANKFAFIKDLTYYASELTKLTSIDQYNENNANLLYKYMFIKNIGYNELLTLLEYNDAYLQVVKWLFQDSEAIKLLMTGGNLESHDSQIGWKRVLDNLANLYKKYKNDFNDNSIDPQTNVKMSLIFKKMLISIALVNTNNSSNYGYGDYWGTPNYSSDKYYRYEVFKKLRLENDKQDQEEYLAELQSIPENERTNIQKEHLKRIKEQLQNNVYHCKLNKEIFDNLPIEYMRWVFHGLYSDNEILWFNYFARQKNGFSGNYSKGGYDFVAYTQADAHQKFFKKFNLNNPDDPIAKEKFAQMDKKYKLSKFGIKNDGKYKFWIAVEVGQVCGGISKHGTSMLTSTGHPASVIGQPGHGAYLNYAFDKQKNRVWNIDNNVGGWLVAEKKERLPLNFVPKNKSLINVNYVILSDRAIQEPEKYFASHFWMQLSKITNQNDLAKLELYCWTSLQANPFNYDAWISLINLYKKPNFNVQTNLKFLLANKILNDLKKFPVVYFELIKELLKNEQDSILKFEVNKKLQENLIQDLKAENDEFFKHQNITREQASGLLKIANNNLATFEFDGVLANKIVINPIYKNSSNTYRFSVDGGKTFIRTSENEISLTKDQILQASKNLMIIVGIMGSQENHNISIEQQQITKENYEINLYEGTLSGNKNNLQWSFDQKEWFDFEQKDLRVSKQSKIFLKKKAFSNKTESNIIEMILDKKNNFEDDIYLESNQYSGLASSEETQKENLTMKHLFDGDQKTFWHTKYSDKNEDKFIEWHFNQPIYISKLEYIPYMIQHTILKGKVFVAYDDQFNKWQEITDFTWEKNLDNKFIYFANNKQIKHLKIRITQTSNKDNIHASAKGFNIWTRNHKLSRILNNDLKISTNSQELQKSNDAIENALNDSNGIWHSKWDKSIKNPYVLFEFKNVKKITKIKYFPRQDVNSGFIKSLKVLVSKDSINFIPIDVQIQWTNDKQIKEIVFDKPLEAKFIKLDNIESYNEHIAAKKFEIFEHVEQIKEQNQVQQNQNQKSNKKNTVVIVCSILATTVLLVIGVSITIILVRKNKHLKNVSK
ncbi:discoidin domain-containing protein [Mycoplasmopsis hyopharyngis]|uniref:discoidin domain-containing protein n=1 Tax=Mycoplasmopsis hyopharyngis TaxID=29558 RepID=UPI0038730CE4